MKKDLFTCLYFYAPRQRAEDVHAYPTPLERTSGEVRRRIRGMGNSFANGPSAHRIMYGISAMPNKHWKAKAPKLNEWTLPRFVLTIGGASHYIFLQKGKPLSSILTSEDENETN